MTFYKKYKQVCTSVTAKVLYFTVRFSLSFIIAAVLMSCDKNNDENNLAALKDTYSYNPNFARDTSITIQVAEGWDLFTGGAYHYGPSFIINADSTIDTWCAANGEANGYYHYWDVIEYKKFGADKIILEKGVALTPTSGSADSLSVCDPSVIKWQGYYYMAYTATNNSSSGGMYNGVFFCRSLNPKGPWEKWNGIDWGGKPQPAIKTNEYIWGYGEPSMLVLNDTLYVYYSKNGKTYPTMLSKADISADFNPAALKTVGEVLDRADAKGDKLVVRYCDSLKIFVAVQSILRMTADSYILLWKSDDGVTFRPMQKITANLEPYLHNCGISGDEIGHIDISKKQYIGYGYGNGWANWSLKVHTIEIKDNRSLE
ncbi:MAG: hypothetical protein ACK5NK_14645 [Niabella sp.]